MVHSVIAFRFIPNSVITRPVSAVWIPTVQEPWYRLPWSLRLTIGWLCLLGIVFGSAFGFKPEGVSNYFAPAEHALNLFVNCRTLTMGIVLFPSRDSLSFNFVSGCRRTEDHKYPGQLLHLEYIHATVSHASVGPQSS